MAGVRFGTSLTYLAVYVAAFLLGRVVVIPGTGLAMFWPAAGVAVLWMLRGKTRDQVTLDALLLVLSTCVVNLVVDIEPFPTILFALANLVQGFVVRVVAARFENKPVTGELLPEVRTAHHLLELGVGTLAGAVLSAPIATAGVLVNTGVWSTTIWVTWVIRNACGALVVAAAVLAIRGADRERRESRRPLSETLAGEVRSHVFLELGVAASLTLASGILVFSSDQQLPIGFVMLASSAWIGFRFTPYVAGIHTLVFGSLAVLCSLEGWGPFGEITNLNTRAIVVQMFVAVTAVITLMLSLGVAERSRLMEQLRASEKRALDRAEMLDAVKDALTDGLAVIDTRGNVLISNPAATALAGGPDDDERVHDAQTHGFYRGDGSPLPMEELPHVRAMNGEIVPPTDYLRINPQTGAESMLSVSAVPLGDEEDGSRLAVLLLHDVSRERAQTRELQAFAGVVAHDLENPLASLMNWAEILDEQLDSLTEDASPARGSLVKIYRSADQMQQLIRDLLVLTKTSSSELALVGVSLDEAVDAAAREVAEQTSGLRPRIEHQSLGTVRADETLVRQVLNNLIGNAVKYVAPDIQPVVRITSRRSGDMIEVRVIDNGLGIPAADRGKVFDSWFRSDSTSSFYPGTGLGLSITARAVERHGGTITVREGLDGTGSIFTFTLPVDPGPRLKIAPAPADEVPEDESADAARRTGSDSAVS